MNALSMANTYEEINGVSCEPLLNKSVDSTTTSLRKEPVISIFALGSCLGCLTQLASLGGSFVMTSAWGSEIHEDQITSAVSLTAFGVAGLISTAVVLACSIVRYLYAPTPEEVESVGPSSGRSDFCFATGIVLGAYVSAAVTKVMIDADFASFGCHAAIAVLWATVCLMIAPRAPTPNESPHAVEV